MSTELPVGPPVDPLPDGREPQRQRFDGQSVSLLPVDTDRDAADLFASFATSDPDDALWTYMGFGPFASEAAFTAWLAKMEVSEDPLFFSIVPRGIDKAFGMASFLRTDAKQGVTEIGSIWFSPALQRTRAASESIYLMMAHVFDDLRYRRLEWKCNALNAASRRAAIRYGFTFEGIFAKHMIVKGRNRDTAWYAMTDDDWLRVKPIFQTWLNDDNFDAGGGQRQSLSDLMQKRPDYVVQ